MPTGKYFMLFAACFFFKTNFLKKFFQEYHLSVSLDQDQVQHFVGPDLGLSCLRRLLAEGTSRE